MRARTAAPNPTAIPTIRGVLGVEIPSVVGGIGSVIRKKYSEDASSWV